MQKDVVAHSVEAADIGRMPDDDARAFVQRELTARRLHTTMRKLNADILSGDSARRRAARKALDKMGFL